MLRPNCPVLILALGCAAVCVASPLRPSPADAVELWSNTVTEAQHALRSNQIDRAIELSEAAISQARSFGPHDTHLAQAEVVRAEIYLWQKDYPHAEATFQAAVQSCEAAVGPDNPALVHPLSSLANFYYYVQPHHDRVAALFERILSIVDHAQPRRDEDVVMWSRNLGQVYQELGDYARAEPLFARAVAMTEKSQPEWLSHELLSQAKFYRAWKKYDQATAIATRALQIREQALHAAPDNVDRKLDLAIALDELAQIHLQSGHLDAAEAEARRSLATIHSFSEENSPDLGSRLAALAEILRASGKYEESAATFRQLVIVTEKNLPGSSELADALSHYADVLRTLHKTDEAAQADAKAAAIRRKATAGA